ncbi:MAG: hypothetical protein ACKOW3_08620 [Hyphomicrobium sp.]
MPFTKKPDGMDDETLKLLDNAMTKLWLEQVAIGAGQKGASSETHSAIQDQLRLLKEPHKRHLTRKVVK